MDERRLVCCFFCDCFLVCLGDVFCLYFDDEFRTFWLGTFSNRANIEMETQPQTGGVPLINANEN